LTTEFKNLQSLLQISIALGLAYLALDRFRYAKHIKIKHQDFVQRVEKKFGKALKDTAFTELADRIRKYDKWIFFSSLRDLKWGLDCVTTAFLTFVSIIILLVSTFYTDNALYESVFIALSIVASLSIFFPIYCTIKGDYIVRQEIQFIESRWILLLKEYPEQSPPNEVGILPYHYEHEIKLVKQNLQKQAGEYFKDAKIHAANEGEEEIALTFLAKAIEIDEKYKGLALKDCIFDKFKEQEKFKWLVG
jgi:hypothetical protein